MNWLQKIILKGVDLRQEWPNYSDKSNRDISSPFTTSVFDKYNLSYDALAKKDYIFEYRNWPYACINARGESLGNIKLRMIDQEKDEEIYDHPLLKLLEKPNPSETMYDLFYGTQTFKDLEGNSFWYLARAGTSGKGEILEIYNLKSDKVKLVLDSTDPLKVGGYVYTQPDGTRIPFKPEEILHQKLFNPNASHPFPHRGFGIIAASAYAIDTDNESRKWNLAFFRNAARPDGVLYNQGEGVMRPEEFKRVTEEWEERHKGSENHAKPGVLSGGMKWEATTLTQQEMDFLEQRRFGRDEILAMFKVPKTVIGIADDVNRANADAAIYVYNLLTVKPLMQRTVDYINAFLLPLIDDSGKYKLDFHSPISEDRAQLLDEYDMGVNVWLTVNEIREREGLPPVEGGDELYIPSLDTDIADENDDDDTTPKAKKMIKSIGKPIKEKDPKKIIATKRWEAKSKATKSGNVEKNEKPTTTKEIVDSFLNKFHKLNKSTTVDADKKESYINEYKQNALIKTNEIKKSLVTYFNSQKKEVLANLKDEMKGLEPQEYYLKSVKDILFDHKKAVAAAVLLFSPFIKDYVKQSGDAAAVLAGGSVFDSATPAIKKWVDKRAEFTSKSITDTTEKELTKTIKDGVDAGETIEQIQDRIKAVYMRATEARTDMIARTEVHSSSSMAVIEAYKQNGITQHQWIVVDPCDNCAENADAIVNIGDPFPNGLTSPEEEHPNCQCTTIPVFNKDDHDDNQ